MKLILSTFFTLFVSLSTSNNLYAEVPYGCERVDMEDNTTTYIALVEGSHTFKGGGKNSHNGYLINVYMLKGEVWEKPEGGADIGYVEVCATTTTTTSTTTSTTTTLPLVCNLPMAKQSAKLQWSNGQFKTKSRVLLTTSVDTISDVVVTLETVNDGVFLNIGCNLQRTNITKWVCNDKDIKAQVKLNRDGTHSFKIRGYTTFTSPSTNLITMNVYINKCVNTQTKQWYGQIGKFIWIKP